jgi:hypothetical protein
MPLVASMASSLCFWYVLRSKYGLEGRRRGGTERTDGGGRKTGQASGDREAKSLAANDSRLEVHEKGARLYELRELRPKKAVFSSLAVRA